MAALTRRFWPDIIAEVTTAVGGYNYTGFAARAQNAIYATYLDLCLTYHHHELEVTNAPAVAQAATSLTLPADVYVLMAVHRPPDSPGTGTVASLGAALMQRRLHELVAEFQWDQGKPQHYARFGSTIYFDRPVGVDAAGTWLLRYYQVPAAPDFSASTSPAFGWLWDEHLIEGSVARLLNRVWRPDLGGAFGQTLDAWLQQQIQPSLLQETMGNRGGTPTADRPHGGQQD